MDTGQLAQRLAALPGAKLTEKDHARHGVHLEAALTAETLVEAVEIMDCAGYFLETITGVDWLGEQEALRKEILAAREAKAKAKAKAAAEKAKAAKEAHDAAVEAALAAGETPPPAPEPEPEPEAAPEPELPVLEDAMEAAYDFNRFPGANGCRQGLHRVALRVRVPRSRPEVPTIQHLYPVAHWHERETHDFFGIRFAGHGYLIPLLLPEDADYHPLRKDFGA